MHLSYHHRRKHMRKTTKLSMARFIMAIGLGAIDTVWAVYFQSFGLSDSAIGYITSALIILSILTGLYSTRVLEKVKETKILVGSLILFSICLIFISLVQTLIAFIVGAIFIRVISVFRTASFDIIFRDEAKDKELNEDEGFMYSLLNLGWFIGPLIAGLIMANYGFSSVFIFATIFVSMSALMIVSYNLKLPVKKRSEVDTNIKSNLKGYFTQQRLVLPYIIGLGLEVWWSFVYIFMPLFMVKQGLGLDIIGFFLAIVTIPLILLEYPLGKASYTTGFKPMFFIGFMIAAVAAFAAIFVSDINIIMVIAILGSIGMAFIEPNQDSYFFRQVNSLEEEKFYPIYATCADIGGFIGRFTIATVLLFFSQQVAYAALCIMMIIFAIISLKVKK